MKFLEIPAIEVQQGNYTFFVGAASAKSLLRVAYVQQRDEGEGVQRILSATRLREIGEYVQSDEPPGLLPNSIILGASGATSYEPKTQTLKIPDRPEEAFVIDGQHRLFAFQEEHTGTFDMPLPVTVFVGVDLETIAYLFRTINSTQRKINPSLVYDLIPVLREKNWVEFEDSRAQYLVQALAEDEESPWYRSVSMLGGRDQPITQASFVTAIKRLLKRGQVFSEQFMEGVFAAQEIQLELLTNYFTAISHTFASEWLNDQFVVSKNLGVSALLNVLGDVVTSLGDSPEDFFEGDFLTLTAAKLEKPVRRMRSAVSWRRADMGSVYLGAAGIRRLTDELRAAL